jgi:large subunit ribosomal protein L25
MTPAEVTKIEGFKRDIGRKNSVDLRENKQVPAVLYGPNVAENIHFSVKELELEKILAVPQTKLQDITIDGTSYRTLLKKVEFDPITDRPLHADFYVLSDTHRVTLRVPVRLVGTPKGVREGGGRLFQPLRIIRIKVLPERIPAEFTIDVSEMEIGDTLHISDLDMSGIIPLDSEQRTIVTVRPPKGETMSAYKKGEEGEEGGETPTEGGSEAPAESPAEGGAEASAEGSEAGE